MDEKTVQVVGETVRAVREEWDWATVKEAAKLAATAALSVVGWWLCGLGLHSWEAWEYDDGTVLEECSSCGLQARPALTA